MTDHQIIYCDPRAVNMYLSHQISPSRRDMIMRDNWVDWSSREGRLTSHKRYKKRCSKWAKIFASDVHNNQPYFVAI